MKKLFIYFMVLLFSFTLLPIIKVSALSNATIDIYTSNKTPVVGSSITITVYVKSTSAIGSYEYTLNYDTNKLKLTSGAISNAEVANNSTTKSMVKKFTFKVIASGSSKVSVKSYNVYDWNEDQMNVNLDPVTINGKKQQTTTTPTYSTNNNLSKLSINGATLSPSFNKNTLEYKTTLSPDTEKITIKGSLEDSKASVSGLGEKNVSEGENKFEIVVTSEKGTKKTYTIIATVKDENPIELLINDKKYTVVKRASVLERPSTFIEDEILINGEKVPGFINETIDYTLIGLKDEEGNISLFKMSEDKYELYEEYSFNQINIAILKPMDIPRGFISTKLDYDTDTKINGYIYDGNAYLYGINLETGNSNWYRYENEEATIQIVDVLDLINQNEKIDNAKKIIIILSCAIAFLSVMLIIVAAIKPKPKKKKKTLID